MGDRLFLGMLKATSARIVLLPVILGGLLGLGWLSFSKLEIAWKEERLRKSREVRVIYEKALARQIAAVNVFERKVDGIVAEVFEQEQWRVEAAAASLTGWKESAHLSYLFAFDSVTGQATAAKFIGQTVNPVFGSPLRRALPLIHREFAVLSAEMATAYREYSEAVRRVSGASSDEVRIADLSGISQPVLPVQESVKGALQTTLNAGFLGLDAVFLPQLSSQIGIVLQAVVSRLTASFATAGTFVVVDGPLPIGDIVGVVIGVGGSIWSAYDLYEARAKLVPVVRAKLHEEYRGQQISLRKTVVAQAYLLLKTYEKNQPLPSNHEKS